MNKQISAISLVLVAATMLVLPAMARGDSQYSGQDLQLGAEDVGGVMVGRDLTMDGTTVSGTVMAGRTIDATGCHVSGSLTGGSDIQAHGCSSIGAIHAGRDLALSNTKVEEQVNVGRNLTLDHASVQGDATVGGEVNLDNARITGTLTIAAPYMAAKSSTISNIHVEQGFSNTNGFSSDNSSIVVSSGSVVNSNINGVFIGGHHGSMVHVGGNSTSSVNGYTVRGANGQTTVITPGNTIYVNGSKVSGSGPDSYADYQAKNPQAPWVEGPGWSSGTASKTDSYQQVVELMEGSVVTGSVTFDSGHGKVLVHPGAKVMGTVTGGTIENM